MKKFSLSEITKNVHLKEIILKANKNLFLRLMGNALGYLIVFLLIRYFGPANYGKWSHSITIFLVLRLVTNIGIKPVIIRAFADVFDNKESNARDYYFKSLIMISVTGVSGAILLFFFSQSVADLYGKSYLSQILKILALGLIFYNYIDLNSAVFKGLGMIGRHTFIENIGNPLFSIIFISIGYFITKEFMYVFYLYVFALFILAILSFLLVFLEFKKLNLNKVTKVSYSNILRVSIPMFLNGSMDIIGRFADILILGFYCTEIEIGAYHLISRIAGAIFIPFQAINSIISTKFRQLYSKKDRIQLRVVTQNSTKLIFGISLFVSILILVGGEWVVNFIEDSNVFTVGWAMYILVFGYLGSSFFGSVLHLLNMTDGHNILMVITIITTVFNVLFNILLIPKFGIDGAAFSTALNLILLYSISAIIVYKRLGFLPFSIPSFKRN
jgi:O-antigen/teichoic acid export membrane protein